MCFNFHQDLPQAKVAQAYILNLLGHLRALHFIFLLFLGLEVTCHHSRIDFVLQVEYVFVIEGFTDNIRGQGSKPLSDDGVFTALLLSGVKFVREHFALNHERLNAPVNLILSGVKVYG